MKKSLQSILSFLLTAVLLCACGSDSSSAKRPPLSTDFTQQVNSYSFAAQPSETLAFSEQSAQRVLEAVASLQPEYPYADMYELDEVKKRLDFDASVQAHQYSALDASGKLTAQGLTEKVLENNTRFMEGKPFGFTQVERDYIAQLCEFIVHVVTQMEEKYPDIDWQRVYCNLGNLKILYDVGMLSYAQVNSDLVLAISKNNTQIILTMKGEDGFSRVLTHEIMHIIQIGCACENIENCGRRAGIAVYWDDFTLNTTDWTWMVEGAAERNMCSLTGGDAVTYQYKMDYLCSMTMAVLLRDSVKADTMETLCFYSDPELLFDAFGCESQPEREELLKLMITLQVLQMQPKSFMVAYKEKTGVDLQADEDALNQFCYGLKPAACLTLSKEFYENLVLFMQSNPLSSNDLFFLINLFEGHLNQHLQYKLESKAQINQPFFTGYGTLRKALFDALEADNPGVDVMALYDAYAITAQGKELLNARLSMLSEEKLAFLAERAQWQAEMTGLGVKVPNT